MKRSASRPPVPAQPRAPRAVPSFRPAARSHWIRAGDSGIHGRGVYAQVPIPDGARVIEYVGQKITKAEAERREAQRLIAEREGRDACVTIFILNQRHDLDGRSPRNTARFINHSCAPNCRADTIRGRIWIVARRDIAEGEELTFDYGYGFKHWARHPCRCGASRCAGYIVGAAQRWRLRRKLRGQRRAKL